MTGMVFYSLLDLDGDNGSTKNSGSSYFLRTKAIHFVNMYISCIYHPTYM